MERKKERKDGISNG